MKIVWFGNTAPEGANCVIKLEITRTKAEIAEKTDSPFTCADHTVARAFLVLKAHERRTAKQCFVPLAQEVD
ncbi:hypothetical protein D9M69_559470 [compost metagenome]